MNDSLNLGLAPLPKTGYDSQATFQYVLLLLIYTIMEIVIYKSNQSWTTAATLMLNYNREI